MATDFISLSEAQHTEPSLTRRESLAAVAGIVGGKFPNWWRWDSDKDENVYKMAEMYVNRHAALIVRDDILYTTTPIHVLECEVRDGDRNIPIKGLWYSNGAVILGYRPDEVLTILYIDEATAKSFRYPMPT